LGKHGGNPRYLGKHGGNPRYLGKHGGNPRYLGKHGGNPRFWGNHRGFAPTEFCLNQDVQDLRINRMFDNGWVDEFLGMFDICFSMTLLIT
jgi:hypothetical protein